MEGLEKLDKEQLPNHIGLILDGNRRWARQRNMDPNIGHLEGFRTLRRILYCFFDAGIRYLTIYALSLENWNKRSERELKYICKLIIKAVDIVLNDPFVVEQKIKFTVLGRISLLPLEVQEKIDELHKHTQDFNNAFLNVAILYDGQEEIVDSVKEIVSKGISPDEITTQIIKDHLYSRNLPELDYLIRTGMEDGARISGFMLWDSSYAEFRFRDDFWPDYDEKMMIEDLEEYNRRKRRKGK